MARYLPRLKNIVKVRLYPPTSGGDDLWPSLETVLSRLIRWDLKDRGRDSAQQPTVADCSGPSPPQQSAKCRLSLSVEGNKVRSREVRL
jgi:hypothetical protein